MRKKALKNKTLFTLLLFSALILPLLFIFSCGEVPERERSTASIYEHTFGEWIVAKEPTCTDEGFRERVCACGEKESEAISALGHTPGEAVTKSGKAADCAEDGWHYTVVYCSVCAAELSRETAAIPPLGHDYVESVRHAWNLVRLDDGNWYWVDVTWDDAGGNNGAAHTWFCLSDETFTDHITDTPGSYAYLYELPSRTGASKYAGSV